MKLPKQVSVLGETYVIKRIASLMEREGCEGWCCSHTYTIAIDSSIKGRALAKVYFHEVGHAFAFESGLHEFMNPQSREMFAQAFANFMCSR